MFAFMTLAPQGLFPALYQPYRAAQNIHPDCDATPVPPGL
jgi:hypothetical protein